MRVTQGDALANAFLNVAENASQRLAVPQEIRRFEEQEPYLKRKCEMAREQGESLLRGERLVIKCSKCPGMSFELSRC